MFETSTLVRLDPEFEVRQCLIDMLTEKLCDLQDADGEGPSDVDEQIDALAIFIDMLREKNQEFYYSWVFSPEHEALCEELHNDQAQSDLISADNCQRPENVSAEVTCEDGSDSAQQGTGTESKKIKKKVRFEKKPWWRKALSLCCCWKV